MFNFKLRSKEQPTVFHVTHPKAGSQWVAAVLKQADTKRFIKPLPLSKHLTDNPIKQGFIYPTVYQTKSNFEKILKDSNFTNDYNTFYVIRDLRDTLVSLYFSLKFSHPITSDNVKQSKRELADLDIEDGLLHLIDNHLISLSNMQTSWIDTDIQIFRYEDMLKNETEYFSKIRDIAKLNVNDAQFNRIIKRNSFESISGRNRGQEDRSRHQRKGISGDWKNYFSDKVKDQFKASFGKTLILTGYESNNDW